MSDDMETVEDTEKGSLAEMTDNSCTVEFIEIVPFDRASDDYHKLEFIDPVVEVKPEDLQEIKQEPAESADENDDEDPNYSVKPELDDESDNEDLLDMKHKLQFIEPVVEVKPEDLLDVKQELADENDDIGDDRASDYHKLEFIEPVVEVKPEDLQEIKQEPSDEYDAKDSFFVVQVSLV